MKNFIAVLGLTSLVALVFADAPIVNGDAKAGVVPDQYIVVYKNDGKLTAGNRKKHEEEVNKLAKSKRRAGISQAFDLTGMRGYAVEIAFEDLPVITKFSEVIMLSFHHLSRRKNVSSALIPPRSDTSRKSLPCVSSCQSRPCRAPSTSPSSGAPSSPSAV